MTIDFKNKLYTASLLFRGMDNGIPSEKDIWEESIVLFFSETEKEALVKAEKLGKLREHSYKTMTGDWLTWSFVQVERVFEILETDLQDGTELFSRYLRNSEIISLLTPFDDI